MRNRLFRYLICFWVFSFNSCEAQKKGLEEVVVVDDGGRKMSLYRNSYALLIGVSEYSSGWPDLNSVPEEIDQVHRVLVSRNFQVERVLNPDQDQMVDAFKGFINRYGYDKDNRLLFFYSGHGYSRMNGSRGYIVPSDTPDPRKNERAFLRKAISMNQILTWCKEMEVNHALFVFDSCFSGTIFETRAHPEIPKHITVQTAGKVRQFITAGDADEEVPSKSVFAPLFIRGINGAADLSKDGYVTGTELGMYLHDKVVGYNIGQTPQYGKINDPELDEGDFVFVSEMDSHVQMVLPKKSQNIKKEIVKEKIPVTSDSNPVQKTLGNAVYQGSFNNLQSGQTNVGVGPLSDMRLKIDMLVDNPRTYAVQLTNPRLRFSKKMILNVDHTDMIEESIGVLRSKSLNPESSEGHFVYNGKEYNFVWEVLVRKSLRGIVGIPFSILSGRDFGTFILVVTIYETN